MNEQSESSRSLVASIFWVIVALAPAVFLEIIATIALSPVVYIIYGAFIIFVFWCFEIKKPMMLLLVAALFVLWLVPWNSRKIFLKDFRQIKPGMTISEVDTRMKRYDKYKSLQDGQNLLEYRHNETDADIGMVHFKNGRVTRTEFHPD